MAEALIISQQISPKLRSRIQEIEMEVEGLDGATASLGFFVVVGILVFGCLQAPGPTLSWGGLGRKVIGGLYKAHQTPKDTRKTVELQNSWIKKMFCILDV